MTHSADDFHERLEGLARAATRGEWFCPDPDDNPSAVKCDQGSKWGCIADVMVEADRAYIAAANPQAVLKLIAENRAYREALEGVVARANPDRLIVNSHEVLDDVANIARAALTPIQQGAGG